MKLMFGRVDQYYKDAKDCLKNLSSIKHISISDIVVWGGSAGFGAIVGEAVGHSLGIPYGGVLGAGVSVVTIPTLLKTLENGEEGLQKHQNTFSVLTIIGAMGGIGDIVGTNYGADHSGLIGGAFGVLASLAALIVDRSIKKKEPLPEKEYKPG